MQHRKKGNRKFGRVRGRRISFLKGLHRNLIMAERIVTTEARAREIKPQVEKLVTLAKKQDLAAMRLLLARLPNDAALKLYYEIAPRYKERHGGYLRVVKMGSTRMRDAAPKALIEFI
ncbi:MAG: 50S ribosomal protein L17 [Patescibacteria group bacterium]|nr:50S ribosomal protein L17 [Patescibacteria group bacterium]MCL5224405.1 50S ribosomal protein L17 [Patescibacteria group bacterium]